MLQSRAKQPCGAVLVPFLRTVLRGLVLAPLVVALISCGSGGGDDEPARHEVPGMIDITDASPGFSTSSATVTLKGSRASSVHTVSWSNSRGGHGSADLGSCPFFPFPFPLPCWQAASIPLFFGENVITVTGEATEGRFSQATTTVTQI
jgi:hypothetical protein